MQRSGMSFLNYILVVGALMDSGRPVLLRSVLVLLNHVCRRRLLVLRV